MCRIKGFTLITDSYSGKPMPVKTGSRKTGRGNERGATVVEFAIIAALLLVILFGILEFGILFMQKHLVEQGAREGVRVGVRANNYTMFDGEPSGTNCTDVDKCDRKRVTENKVKDYLDIFYAEPVVEVTKSVDDADQPVLSVKVTVDNFLPSLILGLVPGYTTPATFDYTATGFYEDPAEFDEENDDAP